MVPIVVSASAAFTRFSNAVTESVTKMHTQQHSQTCHLQRTCSSSNRPLCIMQPACCSPPLHTARILTRTSLHVQARAQPEHVHKQEDRQRQHQHRKQQAAVSSSSRRGLLTLGGAAAAAPFARQLMLPGRASAYIVDETVAQSVFALAARSVVSINDYKQQGGAEVFEGVGTGFVWDKYGHSECMRLQDTCACRNSMLAGNAAAATQRP